MIYFIEENITEVVGIFVLVNAIAHSSLSYKETAQQAVTMLP